MGPGKDKPPGLGAPFFNTHTDVVAHIRIRAHAFVGAADAASRNEPLLVADVITPFKGCIAGETLRIKSIRCHSGPACVYRADCEYVARLRRLTDDVFDTISITALI